MAGEYVTKTQRTSIVRSQLNKVLRAKHPDQSQEVYEILLTVFKTYKGDEALTVMSIIGDQKDKIGQKFQNQLNEKQKRNLYYTLKYNYVNSIDDYNTLALLLEANRLVSYPPNLLHENKTISFDKIVPSPDWLKPSFDERSRNELFRKFEALIEEAKVLQKLEPHSIPNTAEIILDRMKAVDNIPRYEDDLQYYMDNLERSRGTARKQLTSTLKGLHALGNLDNFREKADIVKESIDTNPKQAYLRWSKNDQNLPPLLKPRCYKRRFTIESQRTYIMENYSYIPTVNKGTIAWLTDRFLSNEFYYPDIEKWISTCVLSRTRKIHREIELLRNNESLRSAFQQIINENSNAIITSPHMQPISFDLYMTPTWVSVGYNKETKKTEYKVTNIRFTVDRENFEKNLPRLNLPDIDKTRKLPDELHDLLIPAIFFYHRQVKESNLKSHQKQWIYCLLNKALLEVIARKESPRYFKDQIFDDVYLAETRPPYLAETTRLDSILFARLKAAKWNVDQADLVRYYFKSFLVNSYLQKMEELYARDARNNKIIYAPQQKNPWQDSSLNILWDELKPLDDLDQHMYLKAARAKSGGWFGKEFKVLDEWMSTKPMYSYIRDYKNCDKHLEGAMNYARKNILKLRNDSELFDSWTSRHNSEYPYQLRYDKKDN